MKHKAEASLVYWQGILTCWLEETLKGPLCVPLLVSKTDCFKTYLLDCASLPRTRTKAEQLILFILAQALEGKLGNCFCLESVLLCKSNPFELSQQASWQQDLSLCINIFK